MIYRAVICGTVLSLSWVPLPAFTAAPEAPPPIAAVPGNNRFPLHGFTLEGNSLIATDSILQALQGYLGEEQTAVALLQARDAVYHLYQLAGHEMVSVELPSEIGTDGIVRLRVRETTIGRVTVSGNTHYSTAYLRTVLPSLQEDTNPNLAGLARELFLANDHSGHQMALKFTPALNGQANVDITVEDTSPVRVTLSADNSGTPATGRSRTTVTATHANLWGLGHEGTAGYTTSPEALDKVQQLILSYQLALPAQGNRLQVSYSYSNTDAGRIADALNVSGQGSILTLRLQHDLQRSDTTRHVIELALDNKQYRNTIDFFGFNLGVDVNARPVSVRYAFSDRDGANSTSAAIAYVRNLAGGARNDDSIYAASRMGARAAWGVWRANAEHTSVMPSRWAWHTGIEAQYSAEPLISAEQFGLGGARSVRGFQERETSGDRGWRLSSEVLAPPLAQRHRVLAFIDAGQHTRLNLQPGEQDGTALLSYGLGWRWANQGSVTTSLDWARVVKGTLASPAGSSTLHFSAGWRFI